VNDGASVEKMKKHNKTDNHHFGKPDVIIALFFIGKFRVMACRFN
jgi:hypothetical protein